MSGIHTGNPFLYAIWQSTSEYGIKLHARMLEAWELAQRNIARAQKRQKAVYDRKSQPLSFQEGERVFLYKPAEKTRKARKFARPFHGPYRIMELESNTAKLRHVDDPDGDMILVALERLRRCPDEVADNFWPPDKRKHGAKKRRVAPALQPSATEMCATEAQRVNVSGEKAGREGQQEALDTDTAPGEALTHLSARHSQAAHEVGESAGRKGTRRAKKTLNSKRDTS